MSGGRGGRGEAPPGGGAQGGKVPGKEALRPPPAKRLYKAVGVEAVGGAAEASPTFRILLDGRPIKTPRKRLLALPREALAAAIAAEWTAQGDLIEPASMPLTRIANTAIDAVCDHMAEVVADIVAYAGSDLLCYRAEGPRDLARRQVEAWDPVLAWAEEALGARFVLAEGVMPIEQPASAKATVAAALRDFGPFGLAAVHVLTTLTGSALLALAHARGRLSADEAWAAAHVDEDYQIELWGVDLEASERRRQRRSELEAASRMLHLSGEGVVEQAR